MVPAVCTPEPVKDGLCDASTVSSPEPTAEDDVVISSVHNLDAVLEEPDQKTGTTSPSGSVVLWTTREAVASSKPTPSPHSLMEGLDPPVQQGTLLLGPLLLNMPSSAQKDVHSDMWTVKLMSRQEIEAKTHNLRYTILSAPWPMPAAAATAAPVVNSPETVSLGDVVLHALADALSVAEAAVKPAVNKIQWRPHVFQTDMATPKPCKHLADDSVHTKQASSQMDDMMQGDGGDKECEAHRVHLKPFKHVRMNRRYPDQLISSDSLSPLHQQQRCKTWDAMKHVGQDVSVAVTEASTEERSTQSVDAHALLDNIRTIRPARRGFSGQSTTMVQEVLAAEEGVPDTSIPQDQNVKADLLSQENVSDHDDTTVAQDVWAALAEAAVVEEGISDDDDDDTTVAQDVWAALAEAAVVEGDVTGGDDTTVAQDVWAAVVVEDALLLVEGALGDDDTTMAQDVWAALAEATVVDADTGCNEHTIVALDVWPGLGGEATTVVEELVNCDHNTVAQCVWAALVEADVVGDDDTPVGRDVWAALAEGAVVEEDASRDGGTTVAQDVWAALEEEEEEKVVEADTEGVKHGVLWNHDTSRAHNAWTALAKATRVEELVYSDGSLASGGGITLKQVVGVTEGVVGHKHTMAHDGWVPLMETQAAKDGLPGDARGVGTAVMDTGMCEKGVGGDSTKPSHLCPALTESEAAEGGSTCEADALAQDTCFLPWKASYVSEEQRYTTVAPDMPTTLRETAAAEGGALSTRPLISANEEKECPSDWLCTTGAKRVSGKELAVREACSGTTMADNRVVGALKERGADEQALRIMTAGSWDLCTTLHQAGAAQEERLNGIPCMGADSLAASNGKGAAENGVFDGGTMTQSGLTGRVGDQATEADVPNDMTDIGRAVFAALDCQDSVLLESIKVTIPMNVLDAALREEELWDDMDMQGGLSEPVLLGAPHRVRLMDINGLRRNDRYHNAPTLEDFPPRGFWEKDALLPLNKALMSINLIHQADERKEAHEVWWHSLTCLGSVNVISCF